MQSSTSRAPPWSSNPIFSPTPADLRLLVLDYLCHNSYSRTARAFAADSAVQHLDADGDEIMSEFRTESSDDDLEAKLEVGERRKAIRICILSGKVDEAVALLNQHFPSVLSEEPLLRIISSDKLQLKPSTSVNPAHLALNLRILAFIEAARTVPLPYHPPGASSGADSESPVSEKERNLDAANVQLLHRAQSLYSEANSLPKPSDRSIYLKELSQVCSLLAYKQPEYSPMAKYMTQDRREALADQVDSAILYRLGQPIISNLELETRYTTVLWNTLQELKVKAPPKSAWPVGASLPPIRGTATGAAKGVTSGAETHPAIAGKKFNPDAETTEVVPPFDLGQFLQTSP